MRASGRKKPDLASVLQVVATPETTPATKPKSAEKKAGTTGSEAKLKSLKKMVQRTYYIPPEMEFKLKELKLHKGGSVNERILEGINLVFEKNGLAPFDLSQAKK
jgi:hypothetical protein